MKLSPYLVLLIVSLMLICTAVAQNQELSANLKRTNPGVAKIKSAELIFDIVNTDLDHTVEGFLLCRSPDDATVSSTFGVGPWGSGVQYISPKFTLDEGPDQTAMTITVNSDTPGDKNTGCIVKYIFVRITNWGTKEYLKLNGEYTISPKDDDWYTIRVDKTVPFVSGMNAPACPTGQIHCTANEVIDLNPLRTTVEKETTPPVQIESSISANAPTVVSKRVVPGTINFQDGEIVFEISNDDHNHKLEGYLACDVPSDVIVTSSMGAATGEEAQYISQKFTVDTAPARVSMTLALSSQREGSKNIRCTVNYVLFKEGKGYITSGGQYSSDKKYQQVTVNRDITFNKQVGEETPPQYFLSRNIYYILGSIGLLIVFFLIYKVGLLSGQVKK